MTFAERRARRQINPTPAPDEPAGDPAPPVRPSAGWLGLAEAAAYADVHPDTVYTWIKRGLQGVRLRSIKRPVTVYTRAEWIEDFFQAVTDAVERRRAEAVEALPLTPAARSRLQRRYEAAERRNRKAGRL